MNWLGIRTERASTVAGRLDGEVEDLDIPKQKITDAMLGSGLWAELGTIQQLRAELAQEAGLLAKVLSDAARLSEAADNRAPGYALTGLDQALDASVAALGGSLDDDVGGKWSPDDIVDPLVMRTFGSGGAPQEPDDADDWSAWFANEYAGPILAGASAREVRAFWNSLTTAEQNAIASERPELLIYTVQASGGEVSDGQLVRAENSNKFGEFTNSTFINVDAEVDFGVVTIDIGAGLSLSVTKLSNGTVEMVIVEDVSQGASRDVERDGSDVSVRLGLMLQASQRLGFDNEEDAAVAVQALRDAVASDLEYSWDNFRTGAGTVVSVVEVLTPIGGGFPVIGPLIAGNEPPEAMKELLRLFESNGLSNRMQITGEASATAGIDLGDFVAGDLGVEGSVSFYDEQARDGTNLGDKQGAIVAGSVSISAQTGPGIPVLPGLPISEVSGSGEAGFIQDVYYSNGQWFSKTTLIVEVGVGTVNSGGFGDQVFDDNGRLEGQVLEIEGTTEATVKFTYEFEVPINDQTSAAAADLAGSLVNGSVDPVAISDLWDASTVTITQQTGVDVVGSATVDIGVAQASVETGTSTSITGIKTTKLPGGEFFDQIELDNEIDRQLGGS